ncbi:uncharacterized protein LOC129338004 isoform X1 [Eublepharis macularius]|uniref:Uncharacterized protein LOC129338004 isoform X1 n=1 Tax=Eublepharis macularius TaxID=481883 RepID=A0AA97K1D2_EUBMA|nr:uncharacterized protein LOC129338004 isoform X1 [Eublepharis macularius]
MQMPWLILILAALSALVPPAIGIIEHEPLQPMQEARRRWDPCYFRPGCHTSIHAVPVDSPTKGLPDIPGLDSIQIPRWEAEHEPLQPMEGAERWRRCTRPGCPSPIAGLPEDSPRDGLQDNPRLDSIETLLRTTQERPIRARREEKKVAPARRRGKQKGTRPVCRGCFSGLMLKGQPAQGGHKGTAPESLSESGGASSRGD